MIERRQCEKCQVVYIPSETSKEFTCGNCPPVISVGQPKKRKKKDDPA